MRFESKKKALAEAVSTVAALTNALTLGGDTPPALHIVAEEKRVLVRTVLGDQVVESSLSDDIKVEEKGSVAVDMAILRKALAVSGDTFKLAKDKQSLNYSCGRAKGRLQVLDVEVPAKVPGPVKAVVSVANFRGLLRSISLKAPGGKVHDRTLHFDCAANAVRGEATDQYRGLISKMALPADTQIPEPTEGTTISMSLPFKVMDALASEIDGDALVGFNDSFFVVKAPGLYLCMPQSSSPPLDIVGNREAWIGPQTKHATYKAKVSGIKEALGDAMSMVGAEQLSLVFKGLKAQFTGDNESGSVEADFDVTAAEGESNENLTAVVVPQFLKECLDFYAAGDEVLFSIYDQALVIEIGEGASSGLAEQVTLMPLLYPIEPPKAQKANAKKPGAAPAAKPKPAVEEDDDDAEVVAAPKPVVAKKEPKAVKATKPAAVIEEDDEEPVAKPAKKAAAPKADPEPQPIVEDDDEESTPSGDDEEEESFDDDEE